MINEHARDCSECGKLIPKGASIYKNFAKGYVLLWKYPLCGPCHLSTKLEPKWGREMIMKYAPHWYES